MVTLLNYLSNCDFFTFSCQKNTMTSLIGKEIYSTLCIVLAGDSMSPMYFLNPNLMSDTRLKVAQVSFPGMSRTCRQFFQHILAALFTDSIQTKSGLNWRRSVRFLWLADEWNLFRLAEIVLAIRAMLKAKAIDEWFNFRGYGVKLKLIARWPNPGEFNIRETWKFPK